MQSPLLQEAPLGASGLLHGLVCFGDSTPPGTQAPRGQGLYSLLSTTSWPRAQPRQVRAEVGLEPSLALFTALVAMGWAAEASRRIGGKLASCPEPGIWEHLGHGARCAPDSHPSGVCCMVPGPPALSFTSALPTPSPASTDPGALLLLRVPLPRCS